MSRPVNICSLVVHLAPARSKDAALAIAALPGVEVHEHTQDGRLVVTAIDEPGGAQAFDQIAQIHRTPGVVAASLVYHAFDDESEQGAPTARRDANIDLRRA